MALTFDPLAQLDRFAASILDSAKSPQLMPVDLYRDGDQYVLNADLPGVDPGSIDVDLDGQLLTVRAQRTADTREGAKWLARERSNVAYVRQFSLGDGIDIDRITASYDNGVLCLVIPVSERAKPRKIEIETTPDSAAKRISA